ncbi:MAG: hypothetical protein EA370_15775 [Wenzhouxiangella sp.]|nr:MAG: hypothetical protein EA370_15775 [Wenzhouxiangella sp.]
MKFLLHIGSPKAGSSFLQTLCARSRAQLVAGGIHFPVGTPHDEESMLGGRISAGNALHLARFVREGRWAKAEQWLQRAAEAAQAQDCDRILLSSEWLLGALAHDERLVELTRRLGAMGNHTVELLLVLRDPVGQFISLYKHRAKSGTVGSIDAWAQTGYDLPKRLSGIRGQIDVSGAELVVRAYGKESGALERLFFEDWLGMAVPAGTDNLLVNPSLSLSELVLLRKLRARHPGLVPYLYERLLAVDPAMKLEGQAMQDHARKVATHAVAGYAREWQQWNERLPQPERFAIPESGEKPGSEPEQLELSAAQLGVLMELLADAVRPGFGLQVFWSWRLRPLLGRIKRVVLPWHNRR